MIKECNVILHNSATLVIDFDGIKVQMPQVDSVGKTVYVEYKDGRYILSSKDEYENSLKSQTEKKSKKNKAIEIDVSEYVAKSDSTDSETEETAE